MKNTVHTAKIYINVDNGDLILYNKINQLKVFSNNQLNEILNDCLLQINNNSYIQLNKRIIFTQHISGIEIETSAGIRY